MPKVHKQIARKDYPNQGIKKGETYYWWKFRYSLKQRQKTYPKPAQLTQSEYLASVYTFEEQLQKLTAQGHEIETESLENLITEIEYLRDEQEEKKSNMPESLQESPTAQLLQERYDSLDNVIDQLNSIKDRIEDLQNELEEQQNQNPDSEAIEEIAAQITDTVEEIFTISFE